MRNRWTSRKFIQSLVAEVVGIVTVIWGASVANDVAAIAGAVIVIATTLGYLKTEGDIDKARERKQ